MTGSIEQLLLVNHRQAYSCTGGLIDALRPSEPVYLFCAEHLERRARQFQEGFTGMVSYAVKANPEPCVLQTLIAAGIRHFDVASLEEVRMVLTLCPTARLHFNNPVKATDAVREAYARHGVRSFALDEMSELEKIQRATDGDPEVIYTVRFKLAHNGAAYDFGSKFGAPMDQAARLLREIALRGARPALTFHPGSQCTDPQMYARYLEAASEIIDMAGVIPEFVNVGGGFPVQYLGVHVPPLESYFETIAATAARCLPADVPLMCEPGRAMVADCVSLLTRVIHVRDCGHSVFVNDGVYGGFQEQSIVDLQIPARAWRGGRTVSGEPAPYRIFGPTCDPVDRMQREVNLPAGLREGDYIEFGLLGAYGSATSTSFNGFRSCDYRDVVVGTEFRA
jgi:ornithine decarboxylase